MSVGRVVGTVDAAAFEFWVSIADNEYLQLDDIVVVRTEVPGYPEPVFTYGVVEEVVARFEGSQFASDALHVGEGVLALGRARLARVLVSRIEPELFVPPEPGQPVARATGAAREAALYLDAIPPERRLPAGIGRDGEAVFCDLDFFDGTRGAHVNISGVSGIATKTTYACFLIYGYFHHPAVDPRGAHAVIFNVKGDDLLWLDKPNAHLTDEDRARYSDVLGLPCGPFEDAAIFEPRRPSGRAPGRTEVQAYSWTVRDFVERRMLRYVFADAADDRSLLTGLVAQVEALAERDTKADNDDVMHGDRRVDCWDALVETFVELSERTSASDGTRAAFERRLRAVRDDIAPLVVGSADAAHGRRFTHTEHQVSVVDIHRLRSRAQRFVVGAVIGDLHRLKDASPGAGSLVFVVLDELNKYAPADAYSPIKDVLLDIAERGRSLGIILIGAEQTASEVERRIIANAAIRVVGRLDAAEAGRAEYGFLPAVVRQRARLLKPGAVILMQPQLPVPLALTFPFPAWATREAEVPPGGKGPSGFVAVG